MNENYLMIGNYFTFFDIIKKAKHTLGSVGRVEDYTGISGYFFYKRCFLIGNFCITRTYIAVIYCYIRLLKIEANFINLYKLFYKACDFFNEIAGISIYCKPDNFHRPF